MLLLLLADAGPYTPPTSDGRGSAGASEATVGGASGWETATPDGGWDEARGSAGAGMRGLGSAGGSDE